MPSLSTKRKAHANQVLDSFIDAITEHPKKFLFFLLVVGGMIFSLPMVVIGSMIFLIAWVTRVPVVVLLFVGLLLLVSSWWIDGVSVPLIHRYNTVLLSSLFHGNYSGWHSLYLWLSAIPMGVLFGGLFAFMNQWQHGLQSEVKRVAQGKGRSQGKRLNPKRIQRALNHLSQSAYEGGTVIGVDQYTGESAVLTDKDANLHVLAIGTTGCGKTTGLGNIVESLVLRRLPLFFVDGKGDLELARRIQRFATAHQMPCYLFSMLGKSLKYNPIALGGFTSKKDRIVELRDWSEDHYRKIAEGYLQTVFKVLNKADVWLDLHTLGQHLDPNRLYNVARRLNDTSLIHDIESLENKHQDIQSLIAEIENITTSEIGHLFDCSTGEVITLDRILKEKAIGYFCLQPLAFPSYAELLGKLIINDLKCVVASQLQAKKPEKLYAIFDEFSIFAGDQIINLINQGRGAGVHAILSTQSLSDMLRKGGEPLLGQLLNNVNNYIIQRQNNPGDAEILTAIIGTKESFQITSQLSTEQMYSKLGSIRPVKEFIIHPDEIKRLGLGEAILVNKQDFQVRRIMLRKGGL